MHPVMNAGDRGAAAVPGWQQPAWRGRLEEPRRRPPSDALPVAAVVGIAALAALGGIAVGVADVNAVMLAVAVICCFIVAYDFRFGVVLLILSLPISASEQFPHELFGITGLNPVNLLILGTLASCIFHLSGDRRLRHVAPRRMVWLYVVPICIAALLGSRHVGDIAPAFFQFGDVSFFDAAGYLRDELMKPMFLVLFAVLIGAAVLRGQRPEKLLIPMMISVWVMSLLVVVYFLTSNMSLTALAGEYARQFLTPLGIHANDLGRLYAVAYGLLLFTWAESKNPRLLLPTFATIGILLVALLLTFSRGAFLGFIIVNLLFVIWRASAKTMIGAVLVGALLVVALPGAVMMRLQLGVGGGGFDFNTLSAGRLNSIWIPLLQDLWQSPIWGNGLHSVLWADVMRSAQMFRVVHPHNAYLEVFLDMGIIGLVVIGAFWIGIYKDLRRMSRDVSLSGEMRGFFQGAAAGLVALGVANFAGATWYPSDEQVFLWMAIGMMYGLRVRGPAAQGAR
jgi:O-antigen ligase